MSELADFMTLSNAEEIGRLLDEQVELLTTSADQSAKRFETFCKNLEFSPFYYYG
jgi:hypothetical protein